MNNSCIVGCNDENVENLLLSVSTMGHIRGLGDKSNFTDINNDFFSDLDGPHPLLPYPQGELSV
jgi:hypothetical protein